MLAGFLRRAIMRAPHPNEEVVGTGRAKRWRSSPLKHGFDRIVAAGLLLLLSPLLAAIALAAFFAQGPPVLFRQQRPGLHGKPFTIFKFRTMNSARGADGRMLDDEARLTRFGDFLRSTSLDELPELVNVLRGEMSLVGPRPLLMEYLPRYSPDQARRHEVRPGITGLAQVNGRNMIGWEERFALDLWYIEHATPWLDLKILGLTILKVLTRDGIRAAGHATMPEFMGSVATGRAPLSFKEPVRRSLRFSGRLAAGALAVQLSMAACVAIVDPYDVTGIVAVPGINAEKTHRIEGGARVERSLRLWLSDHDTLILGGSRAWVGIDPAGRTLASLNAYNAAVPGATMTEIHAIGSFALANEQPKRVIISLGFSMFEADRTTERDFSASGFDGDPMPLVYARSLLSPEAFIDALQTVRANVTGTRTSDRSDGFHRRLSPDCNYRRAFTDVLAKKFLVEPWHYAHFEYDAGRVRQLEELLRRFSAAGVEVILFTSPVHARQLEAIAAMGLYPVFERWLSDLAATVDRVNVSRATKRPVTLWDFTGYNSITTEKIPGPNDRATKMVWYWDSSLYTPALGELVLSRMLGRGAPPPADFGVRLDGRSLAAVLRSKRVMRTAYAIAHPEEVKDVPRLVAMTSDTRRIQVMRYDAS